MYMSKQLSLTQISDLENKSGLSSLLEKFVKFDEDNLDE